MSNSGRYAVIGIIAAIIILIIALVASSLKKLASDEVGLTYDNINKKLGDKSKLEGLHNGPPGFSFIIFPSVFQTLTYRIVCLNLDGVQIRLSISYQYRVQPNKLYHIVNQFKDYDGFKDILRPIGESAIHESCSFYNTSQFQAERGKFQEDVRTKLVERYKDVNCDVTDLQVNDIQRPGAYESAVRNKESAREEIEVAKNEVPKLLTEAETVLREDETNAKITVEKAQSQARIIETKAKTEAEGIQNEYNEEAKTYKSLMESNDLDTQGFLAYMGIRAIEDQENNVYVGMDAPAKTNWAV